MTAKHTPWSAIEFREHHIVSDRYDGPVCFVYPRRGVPNEANANLIAAAPDLLAALEAISPMLPRSLSTATWGDPAWTDALGKVEVAIAKAKGEKP